MPEDDVAWMRVALAEARLAAEPREVPVGAVLCKQTRDCARAHRTISDAILPRTLR